MQYLFPLFNCTSYKTSIFRLSCSLPIEGTVKPSSDPSSLAHPSPEVHQWLGRRAEHSEHCITWGSRSQQRDHNPWGAIPASQVLQGTGGSDGQNEPRLLGWLERLAQGEGGCLQAQGQWPLLGTAGLSVAANSAWARVRAAAGPAQLPQHPGWARVQEVLGLEQLWHREHRWHISAFGHAGPGSPNWSPRAGPWLGHRSPATAPWAVQLSIPLSCS